MLIPQKLRRFLAYHADRLITHVAMWSTARTKRISYVQLDYPPAPISVPRWGHGARPHPALTAALEPHGEVHAAVLKRLMTYQPALKAIPAAATDPLEPHYDSGFLFGIDGPSIYAFMRERNPARYVEIGSGNSTLFVDRARRDGHLRTQITSIDPSPRREIDRICTTVVRAPLQEVDIEVFLQLQAGDMVLFDGTHRVFMNSDATIFLLDILPRLSAGVLVGIHDIHLPDDYPPQHSNRYYSEQYLLAAYLIAGCRWLRPVLPCWYVDQQPWLRSIYAPLFAESNLSCLRTPGTIFWAELGDTLIGSFRR